MSVIIPKPIDTPVEQIAVGDWIMVTNGSNYLVSTTGAVGQVRAIPEENYLDVEFQADTCRIDIMQGPVFMNTNMCFRVLIDDVVPIEPPAERIAEEAEREMYRRREELRKRALQRLESRFTDLRRTNSYKRRDKALGQRIANSIRLFKDGYGATELRDALNVLLSSSYIKRDIIERAGAEDELCFCDHCSTLVLCDDAIEVHNEQIETWCESCTDAGTRWSDVMQAHISYEQVRNIYRSTYAYYDGDPDDCCTYHFGMSSTELDYYDGAFVDSDTYYELMRSDEDEDIDEDGLTGYHNSSRHWTAINSTPTVPAIGMELELYAQESRREAVYAFKDAFPNWYFERDGSLDEDYGFEVITQPYGPVEWRRIARSISDIAEDVDARGYAHNDSNMYGIHLNVHRGSLTPLQELRMLMFMQWEGNYSFLVAIAQRDRLYSENAGLGNTEKPSVNNVGGLRTIGYKNRAVRKPSGLGKYSALYLHDGNNIAEFRLFQSTTCYESIMKNLEFVWALIAWTSTAAATGLSYNHRDFVAWLGATQSESTYPHLFAYLRRPYYTGQHFSGRIKNTWATLLPTTTTKSLDVVAADLDYRLEA